MGSKLEKWNHKANIRLNTAGFPIEWLSWQEAVCLHARELVSWTYGEEVMEVQGGYSRLVGCWQKWQMEDFKSETK